MKTIRTLLAAAVILAGVPAAAVSPALAQLGGADDSYAAAAIMTAGSTAAKVARVHDVPSLGVVRLDAYRMPMFGGDVTTYEEFKIMAEKHAAGVHRLQRALVANPATRSALARHNIAPGRVVGAQVSSNGSLRLYVLR